MVGPFDLPDPQALPDAPDQGDTTALSFPRGPRAPVPPTIQGPRPGGGGIDFNQLAGAFGQGGGQKGLNLDTIMPLMLLAAPFLEMRNPGYGIGLTQGIVNYTKQQAEQKQTNILGLAHEFANAGDEQESTVRALIAQQLNLKPNDPTIDAIWHGRLAFQDPNFKIEQNLQQILGSIKPGQPLSPEQFRAVRYAGIGTAYQQPVAGTPAVPGGGELGTRTPPQAEIPGVPGGIVIPQAQPGDIRIGSTWGQAFPELSGNPRAAAVMNVPIPRSYFDKSGVFQAKAAQDNIDRLFGTPFQQEGRDIAAGTRAGEADTRYLAGVRSNVGRIVTAADSILNKTGYGTAQDAANAQQQAHSLLQRARQYVSSEVSAGRLKPADADGILATLPTSFMPAVARQPQIHVNVTGAPSAPIPGATSVRGNPIRTWTDKSGRQHLEENIDGAWVATTPNDVQPRPAKPESPSVLRNRITDLDAKIKGQWSQAEPLYKPDVRAAMWRQVHQMPQQGDDKLLDTKSANGTTARDYAAGISNNMGQRETWRGQLQSQPTQPTQLGQPTQPNRRGGSQKVPENAKPVGTDKRTGHPVFQTPDGRYYDGQTGTLLNP